MPQNVNLSTIQSLLNDFKKQEKQYTKYSDKDEKKKITESINSMDIFFKQEKQLKKVYYSENIKVLQEVFKQEKQLKKVFSKEEYDTLKNNYKILDNLHKNYINERIKENKDFYDKVNRFVDKSTSWVKNIGQKIDSFIGLPIGKVIGGAISGVIKLGGFFTKTFKALNVDINKDMFKILFGGGKQKKEEAAKKAQELINLENLNKKLGKITLEGFLMVGRYLRSINKSLTGADEDYNEMLEELREISEQTKEKKEKGFFGKLFENIGNGLKAALNWVGNGIKAGLKLAGSGIKLALKSIGKGLMASLKWAGGGILSGLKAVGMTLLNNPVLIAAALAGIAVGLLLKSWFNSWSAAEDRRMASIVESSKEIKKMADLRKEFLKVKDKTGKEVTEQQISEIRLKQGKSGQQKVWEEQRDKLLAEKPKGAVGRLFETEKTERERDEKIQDLNILIMDEKNEVTKEELKKLNISTEELDKLNKAMNEKTNQLRKEIKARQYSEEFEEKKRAMDTKLINARYSDAEKNKIISDIMNPKYFGKDEIRQAKALGSPEGRFETVNRPTNFLAGEAGTEHALFIPQNKLRDSKFIQSAMSSLFKLSLGGQATAFDFFGKEKDKSKDNKSGLLNMLRSAISATKIQPEVLAKDLNLSQQESIKAIEKAAMRVGENASDMKKIAHHESGLKASAKADTSSAKGLFQFIDKTWKDMLSVHSKKYPEVTEWNVLDPYANSLMGGEFLKENKRAVGSEKLTDAYLAHFLGPFTAKKFLNAFYSDPSSPAYKFVGQDQASANQGVFYRHGSPRTLGEVYNYFEKSLDGFKATQGIAFKENKKDFIVKGEAGEGAIVDKTETISAIAKYISFAKQIIKSINEDGIGGKNITPNFQMSQIGKRVNEIGSKKPESNIKLENVLDKISKELNNLNSGKKPTQPTTSPSTSHTPSQTMGNAPSAGYKPVSDVYPSAALMTILYNYVDTFSQGM